MVEGRRCIHGCTPTIATPHFCGTPSAIPPKSMGSEVVASRGVSALHDSKKEVPRRVSSNERPDRGPYMRTGQPSVPRLCPRRHARPSHKSSSEEMVSTDSSESGMNETMSTLPCRGWGAGCGCCERSTSSKACVAAAVAAASSVSGSATSFTEDRA